MVVFSAGCYLKCCIVCCLITIIQRESFSMIFSYGTRDHFPIYLFQNAALCMPLAQDTRQKAYMIEIRSRAS